VKHTVNRILKKHFGYMITRAKENPVQGQNLHIPKFPTDKSDESFFVLGHEQRFFLSSLIDLLQDRDHCDGLIEYLLQHATTSRSQLWQDLIVAYMFNHEQGTFLEVGASDGFKNSNTFLLEKTFNWKGVLIEPSRSYWNDLKINRTSALELRAAWKESGMRVRFNETSNLQLSFVDAARPLDVHLRNRNEVTSYETDTITLGDAIHFHGFTSIDYLSCDIEGSEFIVLQDFPLQKYKVRFVSVEHNHSENEWKLDKLITSQGFSRILPRFSNWEAWYVNDEFFNHEEFRFHKLGEG
jgi:FkbM family methyltransferase